jgi:hypothetical protein
MASIYLFFIENIILTFLLASLGIIFLIITLIKPDTLLPLNNLWMKFGLLLSIIISPIVLGLIFFGLITPISLITRLFGRDELNLKLKKKNTYWLPRKISHNQTKDLRSQF